jgi:hypothetical protein
MKWEKLLQHFFKHLRSQHIPMRPPVCNSVRICSGFKPIRIPLSVGAAATCCSSAPVLVVAETAVGVAAVPLAAVVVKLLSSDVVDVTMCSVVLSTRPMSRSMRELSLSNCPPKISRCRALGMPVWLRIASRRSATVS